MTSSCSRKIEARLSQRPVHLAAEVFSEGLVEVPPFAVTEKKDRHQLRRMAQSYLAERQPGNVDAGELFVGISEVPDRAELILEL
jgi:hypothetical protein